MDVYGKLSDNGIIRVRAKFIGKDGSMGFKKDGEYVMWYFCSNGKHYMAKPGYNSTAIPYDTKKALSKNWEFIEH
jgi:hypothetical protein